MLLIGIVELFEIRENKGIAYRIQYIIYIIYHLIVCETELSIPKPFEFFCPKPVILLLLWVVMVSAVYFDDEHLVQADKIDNEVTYHMLPTELGAQSFGTEAFP